MKTFTFLLLGFLSLAGAAQAAQTGNVWDTGDVAHKVAVLGSSLQTLAAAPAKWSVCEHVSVLADYAVKADILRRQNHLPIKGMEDAQGGDAAGGAEGGRAEART